MDELKLSLGSKFMRRLVSKWIVKYIRKQFECDTELDLEELKLTYLDGNVVIKTNLEFRLKRHDVKKILSKLDDGEF